MVLSHVTSELYLLILKKLVCMVIRRDFRVISILPLEASFYGMSHVISEIFLSSLCQQIIHSEQQLLYV